MNKQDEDTVKNIKEISKEDEFYESGESNVRDFLKRTKKDEDGDEDEMEVCELDVDWNGMYEGTRTNIMKFYQEDKFEEAMKEAKNIRNIPLDERVKIINGKYQTIGKIKVTQDEEAVQKYIENKQDQKKCLKILNDIREGKMNSRDRDGYSSGEHENKNKSNDPLLKAAKKAIEANDLGSLKSLSKGCFLPSNISICLNLDGGAYSLFEYSCKVYADDCALYLLEEGGGIKQKFEDRETPLIQALRVGNEEICMFLIDRGADCKVQNLYGHSTLHEASKGNCFEVAKLLIERSVDIEVKGYYDEETPLHWAAFWERFDIAKLLIEKGARINVENKDGEAPLHFAAFKNNIEIAKLLIEKGADIDFKDGYRQTPLHWAAFTNNVEIATLLIEKGADKEANDRDIETPLQLAVREGCNEVAQLLIERGASLIAEDENGETPSSKL